MHELFMQAHFKLLPHVHDKYVKVQEQENKEEGAIRKSE